MSTEIKTQPTQGLATTDDHIILINTWLQNIQSLFQHFINLTLSKYEVNTKDLLANRLHEGGFHIPSSFWLEKYDAKQINGNCMQTSVIICFSFCIHFFDHIIILNNNLECYSDKNCSK